MVTACMHEALFEGLAYEMFPCASVSYCYLRAQTEKVMAPHSSTLAWKIPWTEEPGRLRSMGSLRVGHNSATSLSLFTFMHWRRKWQPIPVFLPRESQGLVGWESGGLQTMGSLNQTRLSDFTLTFHFHALEKEMATHSSVLA